LFDFYSTFVLAHWNNSPQVEMSPHSEYNPNSEPTSICYYSLMLIGLRSSSKDQFYSLWFDMTGVHTHGLSHSRWVH
jgi:hypothetical protein